MLEAMKGKGLETIDIQVIGFKGHASYYAPFEAVGGTVVLAGDKSALVDAMGVTFEGILKLEAD